MTKKDDPAELDQDVARREKFRKLGEAGVPLFPYTAPRTHEVAEVVGAFACLTAAELEEKGAAVVVPGRILSVRKMGRATFFHVSDGRERLQAYVREDKVGAEAYERFGLYDLGDVVSVSGTLFKTRTGELTVLCDAVTFLAKCAETATAPTETVASLWKDGAQLRPMSSDFHSPLGPTAA